jgi:predicted DNA-binding transcriptional regulator AlpA
VEDLLTRWGAGSYCELLRVLSRRQTIELVGVSEKTWERLEAVGDIPIKTRLSQGRVGHRLDHIKEWLDARRETSTARELIDSNWKQVGAVAAAVVAKVGRR